MQINDKQNLIREALTFRHACKLFDENRKIPKEDFELILEAARLSPSSFGFEPWYFIILQNKELREGLIPFCWGARRQLPTASHFVLILLRKPSDMKYDSHYIEDMMQRVQKLDQAAHDARLEHYTNFQKHDFNLLESERALLDWAGKQCYIALANMMLTAAFIGVDSCPIEGFERDAAESYLVGKGVYDPAQLGLTCMVAFGYRVREGRGKTRHEQSEIVRWYE